MKGDDKWLLSESFIHSSNLLLYNQTMTVYDWVVESFNQINDLFYNTDSFSNTNKWLSLWTSQWISHSNNLLHNADLFNNKTSDGPYERVTESFIQMICSVMLIYSVTRQVTGDMNESVNHSFKGFIYKMLILSIKKWVTGTIWMSQWIVHSIEQFFLQCWFF